MLYITQFFLIIFVVFSFGCFLSQEEIKQRRDNAFDLSGKYGTVSNSDVQMNFDIINQTGTYDILLTLRRSSSSVLRSEKDFLSKLKRDYNISAGEMRPPDQIIFGENSQEQQLILSLDPSLEGFTQTDNFSDDLGKTSKFSFCGSPQFEYQINTNENKADEKLIVVYCLSGVVKKESKDVIEGVFSINVSHSYTNDRDDEEAIEGPEPLELSYKAKRTSS